MNLVGEYECTIDSKGRIMLPAALKKQLPESADRLIVKRGFEKCLVLHTKEEWDIIAGKLNKLNDFVEKNRTLKRYYFQGATELVPDSTGRILIPKKQQEFAGLKNDVVLFAYSNKIEIWDRKEYDKMLRSEPKDFSSFAEQVMGDEPED